MRLKPLTPAEESVLIGPAEIALTRVSCKTQISGQIASGSLQGGLGYPHHIVFGMTF